MVNRVRVPLGFLIAGAVFYFAEPNGQWLLAGFPIAVFGMVFRLLAAGTIKKDFQLAETGPYRLTRNPLYFGSFMLAAGFAVMSGSLLAVALLLVPSAAIYPGVIRNEEIHLERLFGENFRSYKRKVPGFFPRLAWPSLNSFSFHQYMANKEYKVALGFAAALAVFVMKALIRAN